MSTLPPDLRWRYLLHFPPSALTPDERAYVVEALDIEIAGRRAEAARQIDAMRQIDAQVEATKRRLTPDE